MKKNPEKSQYKDNGNGTISDLKSGLVWQKCSLGQKGKECGGDVSMNGWSGGSDYNKKYLLPVIHTNLFPNTVPDGYWSSSVDQSKGLTINFGNGPMNGYGQSFEFFVRCVAE